MSTYAIVGGGISGIYLAWRLLREKSPTPSIHIFEKETRLGGRIFTLNGLEMGAGRFNDNHKILLSLIDHFKQQKVPIPGKRTFIKDGKPSMLDLDSTINKIIALAHTFPKPYLKSRSFEMFLKEHFRPDAPSVIDDIRDAFGYTGEFEACNAFDAIKAIELDKGVTQHYVLIGGMSQLVKLLARDITAMGGHIHLNHPITSWDPATNSLDGKRYDHVYFCLTKPALLALGVDKHDPKLAQTLASVNPVPLIRVYATYSTPWFAWMKQTGRITTNSPLRHIIPVNYDTNTIMIAYPDGKWAEWWAKIKPGRALQKALAHNIEKLAWKPSPDPPKLQTKYWDVGVHYWGINPMRYHNNPTKKRYCVCGEVVADNFKCWVEGALSSVEELY
jgi:protoporphyrinogen oxidase